MERQRGQHALPPSAVQDERLLSGQISGPAGTVFWSWAAPQVLDPLAWGIWSGGGGGSISYPLQEMFSPQFADKKTGSERGQSALRAGLRRNAALVADCGPVVGQVSMVT